MPSSNFQNISKSLEEKASIVAKCITGFLVLILTLIVLLAMLDLLIKYFPWFLDIGLLMLITTTPELQQGLSAAIQRKEREHESKSTRTSEPALVETHAHMTPERPIKMSLRSGRLV